MKLLCLGRDLRAAGAQRVQVTLLQHLDRTRVRPNAVYLSADGPLASELPRDCEPFYGKLGRQGRSAAVAQLCGELLRRARRAECIFAMQEGSPTYLAVVVGKLTGKPVVGWIHGPWSRLLAAAPSWHRRVFPLLYPRLAQAVCVSPGVAADLTAMVPSLSERTVVLPNPLDCARIRQLSAGDVPSWFPQQACAKVIVTCGRLTAEKGFDLLLEAFKVLLSRHPEAFLVVAGEGPGQNQLESQVSRLGLRGRVRMPGPVSNPFPLMARASAVVVSSRFEGLGMTLLEAMTLGTPTVAFDCPGGGPRMALDDGRAGLLVPPEDVPALAAALDRILTQPELTARLRDAGLRRVCAFDAPRAARAFEDLFLRAARWGLAPAGGARQDRAA
ncbi:MAG: glycosyltransferase [Bryobacterales bacterium]|nr:glycosyltransferase [Bryobacteraceae bacterium]MDW8355590.1 glycosyltransferase [Bryobacterales bacterium]